MSLKQSQETKNNQISKQSSVDEKEINRSTDFIESMMIISSFKVYIPESILEIDNSCNQTSNVPHGDQNKKSTQDNSDEGKPKNQEIRLPSKLNDLQINFCKSEEVEEQLEANDMDQSAGKDSVKLINLKRLNPEQRKNVKQKLREYRYCHFAFDPKEKKREEICSKIKELIPAKLNMNDILKSQKITKMLSKGVTKMVRYNSIEEYQQDVLKNMNKTLPLSKEREKMLLKDPIMTGVARLILLKEYNERNYMFLYKVDEDFQQEKKALEIPLKTINYLQSALVKDAFNQDNLALASIVKDKSLIQYDFEYSSKKLKKPTFSIKWFFKNQAFTDKFTPANDSTKLTSKIQNYCSNLKVRVEFNMARLFAESKKVLNQISDSDTREYVKLEHSVLTNRLLPIPGVIQLMRDGIYLVSYRVVNVNKKLRYVPVGLKLKNCIIKSSILNNECIIDWSPEIIDCDSYNLEFPVLVNTKPSCYPFTLTLIGKFSNVLLKSDLDISIKNELFEISLGKPEQFNTTVIPTLVPEIESSLEEELKLSKWQEQYFRAKNQTKITFITVKLCEELGLNVLLGDKNDAYYMEIDNELPIDKLYKYKDMDYYLHRVVLRMRGKQIMLPISSLSKLYIISKLINKLFSIENNQPSCPSSYIPTATRRKQLIFRNLEIQQSLALFDIIEKSINHDEVINTFVDIGLEFKGVNDIDDLFKFKSFFLTSFYGENDINPVFLEKFNEISYVRKPFSLLSFIFHFFNLCDSNLITMLSCPKNEIVKEIEFDFKHYSIYSAGMNVSINEIGNAERFKVDTIEKSEGDAEMKMGTISMLETNMWNMIDAYITNMIYFDKKSTKSGLKKKFKIYISKFAKVGDCSDSITSKLTRDKRNEFKIFSRFGMKSHLLSLNRELDPRPLSQKPTMLPLLSKLINIETKRMFTHSDDKIPNIEKITGDLGILGKNQKHLESNSISLKNYLNSKLESHNIRVKRNVYEYGYSTGFLNYQKYLFLELMDLELANFPKFTIVPTERLDQTFIFNEESGSDLFFLLQSNSDEFWDELKSKIVEIKKEEIQQFVFFGFYEIVPVMNDNSNVKISKYQQTGGAFFGFALLFDFSMEHWNFTINNIAKYEMRLMNEGKYSGVIPANWEKDQHSCFLKKRSYKEGDYVIITEHETGTPKFYYVNGDNGMIEIDRKAFDYRHQVYAIDHDLCMAPTYDRVSLSVEKPLELTQSDFMKILRVFLVYETVYAQEQELLWDSKTFRFYGRLSHLNSYLKKRFIAIYGKKYSYRGNLVIVNDSEMMFTHTRFFGPLLMSLNRFPNQVSYFSGEIKVNETRPTITDLSNPTYDVVFINNQVAFVGEDTHRANRIFQLIEPDKKLIKNLSFEDLVRFDQFKLLIPLDIALVSKISFLEIYNEKIEIPNENLFDTPISIEPDCQNFIKSIKRTGLLVTDKVYILKKAFNLISKSFFDGLRDAYNKFQMLINKFSTTSKSEKYVTKETWTTIISSFPKGLNKGWAENHILKHFRILLEPQEVQKEIQIVSIPFSINSIFELGHLIIQEFCSIVFGGLSEHMNKQGRGNPRDIYLYCESNLRNEQEGFELPFTEVEVKTSSNLNRAIMNLSEPKYTKLLGIIGAPSGLYLEKQLFKFYKENYNDFDLKLAYISTLIQEYFKFRFLNPEVVELSMSTLNLRVEFPSFEKTEKFLENPHSNKVEFLNPLRRFEADYQKVIGYQVNSTYLTKNANELSQGKAKMKKLFKNLDC